MTHNVNQTGTHPKVVKSGALLSCLCPHCGESLIEDACLVLDVEREDQQSGRIHLSPQLNVFDATSTIDLAHGVEVADLRCSRCSRSLQREEVRCEACGSRVAHLVIDHDGARTEFFLCLRRGCHWHNVTPAARSWLILEAVGFHRPDRPAELIRSGTPLDCSCPHCTHTLIDGDDLVVKVKNNAGDQGWLHLSPCLNDFRASCTIALANASSTVEMLCPFCETSLVVRDEPCELCGASTARVHVSTSKGHVGFHVCTRRGCYYHGLDDDLAELQLEPT